MPATTVGQETSDSGDTRQSQAPPPASRAFGRLIGDVPAQIEDACDVDTMRLVIDGERNGDRAPPTDDAQSGSDLIADGPAMWRTGKALAMSDQPLHETIGNRDAICVGDVSANRR